MSTFHESTEATYAELPEVHRFEDEQQPVPVGGGPLKAWLSSVGDQLGEVLDVIDDAAYYSPDEWEDGLPSSAALVDPELARVEWLPWLGQLVGVQVPTQLGEDAQRDAVRGAVSGFRAGTKGAIAEAARSVLTGTRLASVYAHSISNPGDGGQWDVLIVTRSSETPGGVDVVQAVIDKGAKPAGVVLHHRAYEADWATLQTIRTTWADWNATWANIQETGL